METNHELGPHSWLDASAIRTASDTVLGGILLVGGTVAIWDVGGMPFRHLSEYDTGDFPAVVGLLLCVVGVILLVRGAYVGSPHAVPPSPRDFLIVVAGVAVFYLAMWGLGRRPLLSLGVAEFVTISALVLAVGIALARASRARATGMVLLGLLLSVVGLSPIESVPRLTMGLIALWDGIAVITLLFGLFVVADGIICLVSPPLLLATYARQVRGRHNPQVPSLAVHSMRIGAALATAVACYYAYVFIAAALAIVVVSGYPFKPNFTTAGFVLVLAFGGFGVACKILGWHNPQVPTLTALSMRIAATLAIAASCCLAYLLKASAVDVVLVLAFGGFGVACKILGWNRLVLFLALPFGNVLETNLGITMKIYGYSAVFLTRPISGVLLLLTVAILTTGVLLSARRGLIRQRPRPARMC